MAPPRDYRKPRNQEMRDLLALLPHPVRVVDGAGQVLWQNEASERLQEEPQWETRRTTWQGQKALLAMPVLIADTPSPQLAELEAENERLRRQQRDTARRKKKAEDSARHTEKAAGDVEKRESKLRQQLEKAERRIEELEETAQRSFEEALKSFEDGLAPPAGKAKSKGKAKAKSKAKGRGAKSQELMVGESFELELKALEQAHTGLRADFVSLQEAEARWREEKRKLEAENKRLETESRKAADARERLDQEKKKLKARVRELERSREDMPAVVDTAGLQAQLEAERAQLDAERTRLLERMEAEKTRLGQKTEAEKKKLRDQLEAESSHRREQLQRAESRYEELKAEYELFRKETEEQETARLLEEQLSAKVREFEELERIFEEEQRALVTQKQELEHRLVEQEEEWARLKSTVQKPVPEQPIPEESRLREVEADLEEARRSLAESMRREARLEERLDSANELREEQSKVMALMKDELGELRERERDFRESLKSYGNFRQELQQAKEDLVRQRAEADGLRDSVERLKTRLLESRQELAEARASAPPAVASSPTSASGSDTLTISPIKSQLDFATNRLRETEKQLDEARAALRKAQNDAVSSKDTEKLAFQDSLTGLPNRHIVDRYLDFSHKQARGGNRAYSLFLIDLDGFRVLNETFGREWGDALLRAVAERLNGMRGANHIFARHSQDRFLLLAADLMRAGADKFVVDASKSLLGALAHPFEVKGESIKLSGSIGIALGPGTLEDPRHMFLQAEAALDTAKAMGAGSYFLHNDALLQKAQRDHTYMRQMAQAIERQEIHAVYQPVFSFARGGASGAELLLRWKHRDQRIIKPDEFLDVALRSGLMSAITASLWPQAFRALSRWRKMRPGFTLSINLSDRELLNPTLTERALGWAREARVEPEAILFEVRDNSPLRFTSAWWSVLGTLHRAGFGLVLDDYQSEGSLFSTLAYAGFVQAKIAVDEKNPICMRAPNAAKNLQYCAKRLQANFDQKLLKKAGFDLAQGYAVASPFDEDQMDGVLK